MDTYCVRYKFFVENKEILCRTSRTIASNPQNIKKELTWDNIDEANCIIDIINRNKKGKIIYAGTYVIKQWKLPDSHFRFEIIFEKIKMSLQEILDYYDSDRAIAYLKERGFNYEKI